MRWHRLTAIPVAALIALGLAACGDDESAGGSGGPTIVVTTPVLGDVVSSMLGDAAEVTVLMPAGASPHDFQASARQAAQMREADLVVANGADLEEGLVDVLAAARADGVTVHEAISTVDVLAPGESGHEHEDHEHEGHDDGDSGHDDHDHGDVDPHFTTDPARTAAAARGILDAAQAQIPSLDADEVTAAAEDYLSQLEDLDREIEQLLAVIPEERRVLVTNHESLGYFADRYGFEVVGAVIPSTSTSDAGNARSLADLEALIEAEGVPAIFTDSSSSTDLADRLAADVGEVEVVELHTESLGDAGSGADTYVATVRTNAERIAAALG